MSNLKNNKNIPRLIEKVSYNDLFNYWIVDKHTPQETQTYFNLTPWEFTLLSKFYNIKQRGNTFNNYLTIISKEDIIRYYIEEDHSYYDTIKYFKIDETNFLKLCKYYNINKKSYNHNKLLESINEEEIINYYSSHSYNDTLEYFGIYTNILDNIINKFNINKKNWIKEDRSKFQDYIDNISKDELYQYYIIEDHTYTDTLNYFDIPSGRFEKLCSLYGIVKIKRNKIFTFYKDAIKNIDKEEFIEYYINQNHSLKETALHFNITEDVTQKLIDELDISKRKHYPELIKERYEQTCLEKYGVEHTLLLDKCKERARPYRSGPNLKFQALLESKGLVEWKDFEIEFRIERKLFDFKIGNYLIEIDPWATHNVTWRKYNHISYGNFEPDYHRKKTLLALENGYKCIHIFDWVDKKQILDNILKDNIKLKDKGEISKHLFNYKTNKEVYEYGPWVVEIYDDGFELEVKNNDI